MINLGFGNRLRNRPICFNSNINNNNCITTINNSNNIITNSRSKFSNDRVIKDIWWTRKSLSILVQSRNESKKALHRSSNNNNRTSNTVEGIRPFSIGNIRNNILSSITTMEGITGNQQLP
jgi:hypothetical protein